MKVAKLVYLMLPLMLAAGCRTHHGGSAKVYTSDSAPYPQPLNTEAPPSAPPPGVSPRDHSVALEVNQLLNGNTALAPAASNVQAIVHQGVVTLRGTVPTERDRKEIVRNVSKLPGVARVDDQLKVTG